MAGSFNKVILMGNLVRDPELRYTPQGTAVTDIRLAINDPRAKNQDRSATFVDVTMWERSAEVVCEYMRKGSSILVEGRLVTDNWEDRESGKRMSKLKVVAQNFQFVDSRGGGNDGAGGGAAPRQGGGGNYGAPRGGQGQPQGGDSSRQYGNQGGGNDYGNSGDDFGGGGFSSDVDDIPF